MVDVYIDLNCADNTGTTESPYFTALLGVSTNGYQTVSGGSGAGTLASGDTLHIAPGTYSASGQLGGVNYRRYIKVYGVVKYDGTSAGDVHGIAAQFAGWVIFQKGTTDAMFYIQNFTSNNKQMMWGTPGRFQAKELPIVVTDCPLADAIRVFDSGIYDDPEHEFNVLILNNIRHGVYADGSALCTLTINNLFTNKVNRDLYLVAGPHIINVNHSLQGRSYGYHAYGEAAWAGTATFNNCLSIGGAAPQHNINPFNKLTGTGTVNLNNCFVAPSPRFANTTFQTVNSNVTLDQPILRNAFMEGSVSFNIDDSKNETAFYALTSECNARGLKCGWAIDWHNRDMDAAKWVAAKAAKEQGHDLYIHTTHSANMGNQFAFRVIYTGLGLAASLDIDGDSLTTTVDAAQDLNVTLSDYDSVIDLVAFFNTQADYSAETFDQDTVRSGVNLGATAVKYAGEPSTDMFGTQNKPDIKTSAVDIAYNSNLFFTKQITENKNTIFANTGYMPTSMVYPGGEQTNALQETIEGYGVAIARATLPVSGQEKYYPDDIDPLNMSSWPIGYIAPGTDSEAVRRQKLIGFFEWVKVSGAKVNLWEHGLVAYSQAEWAVVLDAAVECGIPVKTLTEQAVDMRKGTRTVSSGRITYSQEMIEPWIAYCYAFEFINGFKGEFSGLNLPGPNKRGIDGELFSNIDVTIGPKQSKNGAFFPTNV